MAEELLINVSAFETRVALLAEGHVQEIHLARPEGYSRTGNIYLGKVERVVPGMQAAFVDCGLDRPGFLHVRDIEGPRLMLGETEENAPPDIRELLREGQRLMVQVAKDPISGKGARLNTKLAIASRYLVLMPFNEHIGISQRMDEEVERERLRAIVARVREDEGASMGYIVRTAAEGIEAGAIAADMRVLARIWDNILAKRTDVGCPGLLYEELPIHIRTVRDMVGTNLDRIQIDHLPTYERVREFVSEFLPDFVDRVSYCEEPVGLLESRSVHEALDRCLDKKVGLRSGGHLVIEQTEAMITIDVNTGSYLGAHSLEETVFQTNLEAAETIPRQLRLRNLGGIVVIDFIDMEDEEHENQVIQVLQEACAADPAKIRLEGFSSLGLVQMSRKRTRESLTQQVCEPCGHCAGVGVVKTPQTTSIEIFRAVADDARVHCGPGAAGGEYLIRANEPVIDRLLDEDAAHLEALSQRVGCSIRIQVEPSYAAGQFDVVRVRPS